MKRSDALDLIDEVLFEHELPLLQGISKEILGKLEKAGMMPPCYCVEIDKKNISEFRKKHPRKKFIDFHHYPDECFYEWEKE